MGKRQDKHPFESNPLVEDSIGWTDSPDDELSNEVMDSVWTMLDKANLNARKRKIVWAEGQKMSINQSIKRIHAAHPSFALELIESHLIGWLRQVLVSPYHSEQQLGELNRLTEKWIEAHQSHAVTAQKRARTRHS